ncbi:hypothetical protein [Laspinema palackyanum]
MTPNPTTFSLQLSSLHPYLTINILPPSLTPIALQPEADLDPNLC